MIELVINPYSLKAQCLDIPARGPRPDGAHYVGHYVGHRGIHDLVQWVLAVRCWQISSNDVLGLFLISDSAAYSHCGTAWRCRECCPLCPDPIGHGEGWRIQRDYDHDDIVHFAVTAVGA